MTNPTDLRPVGPKTAKVVRRLPGGIRIERWVSGYTYARNAHSPTRKFHYYARDGAGNILDQASTLAPLVADFVKD